MEDNTLHTPEGFSDAHRTMMYAADRLNGGGDFVDADAGKDQYGMPTITGDPRLEALNADGISPDDRKKLVDALVKDYGLDTIAETVKEHATKFGDADREGVVRREADTADMMIKIGLANARGEAVPSYEDRIKVITGKTPIRLDAKGAKVTEVRELMKELLARQGFTVTNGKTLDLVTQEWETSLGHADTSDFKAFQARLKEAGGDYLKLLQTKVLGEIDPRFAQLPLTGLQYTAEAMNFDAFLAYTGGQDEKGNPLYKGTYKWNHTRPAPWADVQYITAHESTHYAQAAVQDFLRRGGKLGPEAAFTTMSSPMALQTEGLAQVAPLLVSGGTLEGVIDQYGLPYATLSVQDRLQDMVRVWVGEQVELEGKDRLTLGNAIQTDFLQTVHIAKKYVKPEKPSSYWANNPIGQMYGPSYLEGSETFRTAIEEHGVLPVARTAFHVDGFTDLEAFKAKLARKTK